MAVGVVALDAFRHLGRTLARRLECVGSVDAGVMPGYCIAWTCCSYFGKFFSYQVSRSSYRCERCMVVPCLK